MTVTKFNPENKEELTYRESLGPAMEITDEADAQQYLRDYIAFVQKHMDGRDGDKTAEEIAKGNLGYYAGYYDDETWDRVERLFCCAHPIFGSIARNSSPTPTVAFEAGKRAAQG